VVGDEAARPLPRQDPGPDDRAGRADEDVVDREPLESLGAEAVEGIRRTVGRDGRSVACVFQDKAAGRPGDEHPIGGVVARAVEIAGQDERVPGGDARQGREDEGRALAYKVFSAEYFYAGLNPSGSIFLRSIDERFLLRGWHTGSRRTAKRTYRRALYPEACLAVPLDALFPLRVTVSARAPDGLGHQTLALAVNDRVVGSSSLGSDWQELPFVVPEEHLIRGKNDFCLRFGFGQSEPEEPPVAALVEKIQLP